MTTELDAFSALLYDHKFDVDDIIIALCGTAHTGRWLLNSRTGTLKKELELDPTIQDGGDVNHWHVIMPLPNTFLTDLQKTTAFERLDTEEQKDILNVLQNVQSPDDLPQYFEQNFTGGWLRERVKDAALLWLDSRGMIPPSMQHVYHRHKAAQQTKKPKSIQINT